MFWDAVKERKDLKVATVRNLEVGIAWIFGSRLSRTKVCALTTDQVSGVELLVRAIVSHHAEDVGFCF